MRGFVKKILSAVYHFRVIVKVLAYNMMFGDKLKIDKKLYFRNNFYLRCVGGEIIIGKNVFFNNNCSIVAMGRIKIGDNTILGENVKIYDHNHRFSHNELKTSQGFKIKNVSIGKNCWIASNVILLAGSEVGDNSVIGAGVVVDGNIPKDSVVRLVDGKIEISNIKYK